MLVPYRKDTHLVKDAGLSMNQKKHYVSSLWDYYYYIRLTKMHKKRTPRCIERGKRAIPYSCG